MFKRGDVVWVKLQSDVSSKQAGVRPAILISNNKCLEYSPVVHIIPLTTQTKKALPTHVKISMNDYPIEADNVALCEQTNLISKDQIESKRAEFTLNKSTLIKLNIAIIIQFGLMFFVKDYSRYEQEQQYLRCA